MIKYLIPLIFAVSVAQAKCTTDISKYSTDLHNEGYTNWTLVNETPRVDGNFTRIWFVKDESNKKFLILKSTYRDYVHTNTCQVSEGLYDDTEALRLDDQKG